MKVKREYEVTVCDLCGSDGSQMYVGTRKCELCDKDACRPCIVSMLVDGTEMLICKECNQEWRDWLAEKLKQPQATQ